MANNNLLFLILLMTSRSICEECITYNFEKDFDKMFTSGSGLCLGMGPWKSRNFTSLGIESVHSSSTKFISPSQASCTSSFNFLMGRGTFEFNVYVSDHQISNSILIYIMAQPSNTITFLAYDSRSTNFVQGWNILRITIDRLWQFEGYVVLMGVASPQSLVLVDSFRYIPLTTEEENCILYEDNFLDYTSTTDMHTDYTTAFDVSDPIVTTNTTQQTDFTVTDPWIVETTSLYEQEIDSTGTEQWVTQFTTTESTDLDGGGPSGTTMSTCIIYNFEENFNTTLVSGSGVCTGANPWTLSNFNSVEIKSLHPLSTLFIAPTNAFSCIKSSNFKMGNGTFEFNVFMGNEEYSNFTRFWMINILVQMKYEDGIDKTVAVLSYNSHSSNFRAGWNSLRIILERQVFDGNVVLMGVAAEGSNILVDSFRYIPSTTSEGTCLIYDGKFTTTSLTTDTEIIKSTVTEPWKTESPDFGHETASKITDEWISSTTNINGDETVITGLWTTESTASNGQQTDSIVTDSLTTEVTNLEGQDIYSTIPDQWITKTTFVVTGPTESAEYQTDSTVTEQWTSGLTDLNGQETSSTSTEEWVTKTTIVYDDTIVTGQWTTESTESDEQQTVFTVTEPWTTGLTDLDEQETDSITTGELITKTTVADHETIVTGQSTTESTDSGGQQTDSTATEPWTTGLTDLDGQETDSTTTVEWITKTTFVDNETIVTGQWTTKPTELDEQQTDSTVTEPWTTGLTDLDGQETDATTTAEWITKTTVADYETIVTGQFTTESTDSGGQQTDFTAPESLTTGLTDLDWQETDSTTTVEWVTKTTVVDDETIVTGQWTTKPTELDEQQTDSTVTEPWTTGLTDLDGQETDSPTTVEWITKTTVADHETIVTGQFTTESTDSGGQQTDSKPTESWTTGLTDLDGQETDSTTTTVAELSTTDSTTIKEVWTTTPAPNIDGCIKYDFEKNFEMLFSSRSGNCRGMTPWTLNSFTSVEIENQHHSSSNLFISPSTALSCVTSFNFVMGNGTLEFNVYIGDTQFANIINIMVMESSEDGIDFNVGNYMYSPISPNFEAEWNILRIEIDNPRDFEGYIVLQGALAELNSVVLVDSFRYIPSTVNEELCKIY